MKSKIYVIVDGKFITKSIDGVTTEEYARATSSKRQSAFHGFGRDDLPGGVNGMLSHADGKRYDSKSNYERSLKAKGCRVVGNDWNKSVWKPPIERGVRGDFNVRPQLKEAIQKVMN